MWLEVLESHAFRPEGANEHWLTVNNRRVFTGNLNYYTALKELRPDLVPLLISRMHSRWPNSNTLSFWEKEETWVEECFSDLTSREADRVDDTNCARGRQSRNNFKQCQRLRS